MPDVTADQFAQRAVDLGLIEAPQLERLWADLGSRNVDVDQMISAALRRELLTNWHVDRILEGKRTGYFYGKYKVLYLVGAGTFARVYRSVHVENGEVVALKVLRQRYADDMTRTEQFLREAQTVKPLRHPNIVPIHEVASERGRSYMVMDFVEGQNLRDWLKRARLSVYDAIRLITDIVSGLDYAFKQGITHRDMKLSNVLVSSRGRARLVDFGLAVTTDKITEANVAEIPNPRSIDYAGLERAAGVPKDDQRSDLFFVGVMLYHMLTGQSGLPEAKDRIGRLNPLRYKDVKPIAEVDPNLPARIVIFVNKAVDVNADNRFQTPAEMLEELGQIKASLDPSSREVSTTNNVGAAKANTPGAESATAPLEGTSRTVMLVESNQAIQNALREKLKRVGYRVLVISDPARALLRFEDDESVADCVVFGTGEMGVVGLNAFNLFATGDITKDVPAILLVDKRQEAQVKKEAKLAEHRVIVSMPLKFKDIRLAIRDVLATAPAES